MTAVTSVEEIVRRTYDWLLCHASVSSTGEICLLPIAKHDAGDLIARLLWKLYQARLNTPDKEQKIFEILHALGLSEESLRLTEKFVKPGDRMPFSVDPLIKHSDRFRILFDALLQFQRKPSTRTQYDGFILEPETWQMIVLNKLVPHFRMFAETEYAFDELLYAYGPVKKWKDELNTLMNLLDRSGFPFKNQQPIETLVVTCWFFSPPASSARPMVGTDGSS